jgi:hypothetical protein
MMAGIDCQYSVARWIGKGKEQPDPAKIQLRLFVQTQYLVRFSTVFAAILEGLTWNAR